jgi:hypothetical protein
VGARRASARVRRQAAGTRRPCQHTIIVDDLDTVEAGTAERGLQPAKREAYDNGVRKITYIDPDGNEIGYGAVPR